MLPAGLVKPRPSPHRRRLERYGAAGHPPGSPPRQDHQCPVATARVGDPAGGVPQAAGAEPVPAGQGNRGPGPADQRDCARPAPHQRGHCAAPGPLLRNVGAVLDQPAVPLRHGDRKDRLGDALDGIRPLTAAS